METYSQFLTRVGLTFSEANLTDSGWVEKFWNAIRDEKIAQQDYNFIGFIFPYFDIRNFHIEHGANRIEFNEKVDFQMAQFRGRASFSSMTFNNLAVFSGADFYENVEFSQPWFMEEAQFDNCNFRKGLTFWGQFVKKCHFRGARFSSEHKTIFRPIGDVAIFGDTAEFTSIIVTM